MDQCSRVLAFYKSGMPIRDRSITSLWSKTRDRPSRIGITDWHPGLSFQATVSNLPMVDGTYSSLEIARVASDSGGDVGILSHYIESHMNTYSDQTFQQQPHLMTCYSIGRWRWRIFLYCFFLMGLVLGNNFQTGLCRFYYQ